MTTLRAAIRYILWLQFIHLHCQCIQKNSIFEKIGLVNQFIINNTTFCLRIVHEPEMTRVAL